MDRYAVIGNPIAQSKSPFIHTLFARQTQQDMVYDAKLGEPGEFDDLVSRLRGEGYKGFNITAPFKEDAFAFATGLSKRAKLAGAVNTLNFTDDGLVFGDTTDGAGLLQDLKDQHVELRDQRILLLGAGGAARGVLQSLLQAQPKSLLIANRSVDKAEHLAQLFSEFKGDCELSFTPLDELSQSFDLVINSTSAGLHGELPQIPAAIFGSTTVSYDMSYSAELTGFNRWAQSHGAAKLVDGLGMLVNQAAESFSIWRGIRPGTRSVYRELRRNMSN
ncbi:shikimate dehydrogenase [Alginatibacterium sediminis]|uniref:Shikimate dehydrogenase (NADP(+)) n=1 Tax=Alginatibacterium sediminis TaxID=2164068 RepID=A0A420EMY2_9ALTE|nr:shikimate dehydrogenase [Alginatibacterium sediminis]RKF22072.1 shikimate dehydrogenase [Alginatibacterium sediminis]